MDYVHDYIEPGDDHEREDYLLMSDSFEGEEHEMLDLAPQESHQQTQINQQLTGTTEKQVQDNI